MAGFRAYAKDDSDFDPIRDEPAFEELIARWISIVLVFHRGRHGQPPMPS